MYEDSVTSVRCVVGMTEGFKVEVGLHQGSDVLIAICYFTIVWAR